MEQFTPFTIYNASAGSGKTFMLVQKYLSLLFTAKQKDAYKNILAITFTNKAVKEMKTRIIDSLVAFSEPQIPAKLVSLLEAIQADTGLSETNIQEKSKKILKSIVHNYAAFEVSTIDAFTNRVLRTFAKDLGLSVNFEVELDTQSILAEAVDRLVAKAGENQELTKTLVDFALSKADNDKSWDISKDLNETAKLLTNENNFLPLERLKDKNISDFRDFHEKLRDKIALLEKETKEIAGTFFALINQQGLESSDFAGSYLPNYFLKLQNKVFDIHFEAKWQVTISEKKMYPNRVGSERKKIIDQLQPEIVNLFLESKKIVLKRNYYREIAKNIPQLSLLNAIRQEVETIKKERNLLLISEFNKKISASIRNQPVPFIYERLGERYWDYFIDEFQDTSQLQWENLIPLIDSPLTSENEQGKRGSLTIVGDAKQAIYRWRGGKADQFMALCQDPGSNPFSVEKKLINLPSNYRSKKEIVDFNNAFFKHTSQFLGLETHQQLFENARQNVEEKVGGYVNISFVEAKNKEEKNEVYPKKTLEIIRKLERNGYKKADICILVRKKDQGIAVANFLTENEIPIISSETLLVSRSPKVQFIRNLLAFSQNQGDAILKVDLLYYLYEFFTIKTEQHLFISEGLKFLGAEFFDYLEKYGFYFSLEKVQSLPLYDAVEYILRSFDMLDRSNAYVQFFLDFVLDYTQKNRNGISGFLEHWESKKDSLSIVAPEAENAVRIMTIHKSKGLEFPIVIYPYANETIDDTKLDNTWVSLEESWDDIPLAYISASKKLLGYGPRAAMEFQDLILQKELDAMNMLYVACTRAEQQLHLISEMDLPKKTTEKWNKFSHFFIQYLKSTERWKEDVSEYEFGELIPNPNSQEKPEKQQSNEKFITTAPSSHNLNIVTKSGSLWGSVQETAIREGDILHEIMNYIETRMDMETALKKAVDKGIIVENETEIYQKLISKIMVHPDLKSYFEPGIVCYNEREILNEGEILRPDRITIQENTATVIDYKTGKFLPKHEVQINQYAEAIRNLGYFVDKKVLIYINDKLQVKIV